MNIILWARLVKKVVAILCIYTGGWGIKENLEIPVTIQSFIRADFLPLSTPVLPANVFQREKTVRTALCILPQGVA